jgi:hypothetical protein
MASGTPGNGSEFLRASLAGATWQALKALPESFGYDTGHGFACLLSEGRREPMSFRVFDVEGFRVRCFCKTSEILPFYRPLARSPGARMG